jgi:hypothetical protein
MRPDNAQYGEEADGKMKKLITLLTVSVLVLALVPSVEAALVTHYKLDEASSSTTAVDATGNGNDGAMTSTASVAGSPDPTSTTGVSMPSPNLLSGVTGLASADDTFTIMFWLQGDNFVDDTFARFLSIGNDATGSEAIFAFVKETEYEEDQVEVIYYPDGNPTGEGESNPLTVSPNPLTTGWTHHAAVVDGLSLTWYVDGEEKGSGTMAGALTNTEFYILGSPTQTGNGTAGSIDEVGVFDEALGQTAIQGFIDNGLAGDDGGTPGTLIFVQ